MITYLINISITWILLFVLYKALLEKEKHFKLNRIYLLSSLVMGLLLPLISYVPVEETAVFPAITSQISDVYQSKVKAMETYASPVILSTKTNSTSFVLNWMLIFQVIYFLGLSFALLRIAKSFSKLYKLLVKSQVFKKSTHSEIIVSENILPFSFMQYVFIGNQDYNSGERNNILNHELYHVQSLHSIDVLFVELLKIIFWWHPMVYFYKQTIAENHEYSADQAVLIQSSRKQYCELLMKATFPGVNLELTNPFFQTFIKKRITMMYQKESSRITLLKYPLALIAVVFMATIFVKPLIGQVTDPIKIASITGLEKYEKKDALPMDIYTAKVTQEGKKLVLDKDYEMHSGTGKMKVLNDKILKNEKPIKVEYLEGEATEVEPPTGLGALEKTKPQQKELANIYSDNRGCKMNSNGAYYDLDKSIRLPSCPDGENGISHARSTLNQFAAVNFNYPAEAIEEGYQEFMLFYIAIDKEGNLSEILPNKYMKNEKYPYGIEAEQERIVDLMREKFKFSPAECDGTPVKTSISFLLKIRIPENKRNLVKVKDASNVVPNQQATITGAASEYGIGLTYYSNMNVAFSLELENPDGKVVFTDSRDYMYSHYREGVQLSESKNGRYTLRVTQDGQVKETFMDITVFK